MQRTTVAREKEIRAGEGKSREEKQMRKEGATRQGAARGRRAAWKRALINLRTWKAAVQRDVAVPHLP